MSVDLSRRSVLASAGAIGAAALVGAGQAQASSRSRSAALVVHNARVYTGVRGAPLREAVAVGRDGTILAVGRTADLRRYVGRDTESIDAHGATVMSGLHDGHAHPLSAGERSLNPSLGNDTYTVAELQAKLTGFLTDSAAAEPDGWLRVEDWNPVGLPVGTATDRALLDALPTRRPIALFGSDGHNLWANTRALEIAGITGSTPNPPAGEIVHRADGTPSGLLKDDAQGLLSSRIPAPTEQDLVTACAKVLGQAASFGITAFMDASVSEARLKRYEALASSGRLPQRILPALRLSAEQTKDPAAALAYVRGLRGKYEYVPGLTFGTVKVFLDGVIEYPAQTAALLSPYLDGNGKATDNVGDLYVTAADYGRLSTTLDRDGWQMHAHAIGDGAVRAALDGYEQALRVNGRRGHRHTVAHLQLVHPDDYRRFAALDVVASFQLQWAQRDVWTMDALLPYIGPERHRRLYPARSLERQGARLAGGSDWPVDSLNPWNQIRTAIDRHGTAGEDSLYPELQGLGRDTSLWMHTAGAAYQMRMERRTGTLAPGREADLILLDRDVTRVPVTEISDTAVRLTLIGGKVVHEALDAPTSAGKAAQSAVARPAALGSVHGDAGRHEACGCTQA